MIDAGCVTNDKGRSLMFLGLCKGLNHLLFVSAHGDGGNIDGLVEQCYTTQSLLARLFAGGSKLGNCPFRGRFRRLSTGVLVHFRIHHQYVNVFT